jgi:hypothetical protein
VFIHMIPNDMMLSTDSTVMPLARIILNPIK